MTEIYSYEAEKEKRRLAEELKKEEAFAKLIFGTDSVFIFTPEGVVIQNGTATLKD